MCVVSMVMDHYREEWGPRVPQWPQGAGTGIFPPPNITIGQVQPAVTDAEIVEFRKLLDRAREYDKRHNEPDCELDEKRLALKKIAKELGVDISFVDTPPSDQQLPTR